MLGKKFLLSSASVLCLALSQLANADPTPYPDVGTPNPTLYNFTASTSGDIVAYFAGSTASYDNTLSLLVNGVNTGISGLDDHTSQYGQALNFGYVTAGSTLTFQLNVLSTGDKWFSNASLNSDGGNHIYSNYYSGDALIPAGTYVAFEDENFKGTSDYNYHDENFVFTNVSATPVPEPQTYALMLAGLGLIGFMKRRKSL